MVLDEGHSIKNIKSSRFQRLRVVNARHRLLLRCSTFSLLGGFLEGYCGDVYILRGALLHPPPVFEGALRTVVDMSLVVNKDICMCP